MPHRWFLRREVRRVAFREARMSEVREMLGLTVMGHGPRAAARLVDLDRKTVCRSLEAAAAGLQVPPGTTHVRVHEGVLAGGHPESRQACW
jgi:hypothetical protein